MRGWVWVALPVTALAVLVLADRLVARLPDRVRRRRRPRRRSSGGAGPLGELVALFQPGLRHHHEEQERRRMDLVTPASPDPAWAVDLDAGTAVVPGPADHDCRLVAVAPGVWSMTTEPWASASTIVVAPDRTCLVVDPNIWPADLEVLAGEIRVHGWSPVAGFSTHPHWDHVLWCSALGSVPRWATPLAAGTAAARRRELAADADAVAPGHDHEWTGVLTALEGDRLPWGGPTAIVLPYPGHCPGSAALWFPDRAVLVSGDMLSDVEIPLLGDPTVSEPDPLAAYASSLETLAAIEAGVVVPGHGTSTDAAGIRARLAADRAYLDLLRSAGRAGAEIGAHAPGTGEHDPRLADPEQAEHHARQAALVASLPEGG